MSTATPAGARLTGWVKDVRVRRPLLPPMRFAHLPVAAAIVLSPTFARGQSAPPPVPAPVERAPTPPGPRSRAVAIPIEILSPVGGAGCFYRGRIVAGAVVTVASLATGGTMLWGVTHGDRDVTIINAVAYGIARAAGIYLAAEPVAAPAPPPPLPSPSLLPPLPPGKTVGFWPRFSF